MAGAPKQQSMTNSVSLNVNGLDLCLNGDKHFTYKLPYAIQLAKQPLCTRLGWLCCPCCCPETGPQDALDFVDQNTGDQVRFHRIWRKVRVFYNGQYQGYMRQTWRLCGRCRNCVDEVYKGDVPAVSLYDQDDKRFSQITRKGRGCCMNIGCDLPLKCIYGEMLGLPVSFLACCTCTCECWPSAARLSGFPFCCFCLNGAPSCGLPHGCLLCDMVCCECCIRGQKKIAGCNQFPCITCCNPCGCIACCCCCPTCDSVELPIHSTVAYKSMAITADGQKHGDIRMQYRGNVPFQSAFMHEETKPVQASMETTSGDVAKTWVSSAVLMASSYGMGLPTPMLEDMKMTDVTPGFDGYVMTAKAEEVTALIDALDENNKVTKPVYVGFRNVTGYTLIEVGYDNSWLRCCYCMCAGGSSMEPRSATNKQKALSYIDAGKTGGVAPTFFFRFYLQDPEKPIMSRKTHKNVHKNWYDFYHDGREQVYLTCSCIRFYRCPCDFTVRKNYCCRIPVYQKQRQVYDTKVAPEAWAS